MGSEPRPACAALFLRWKVEGRFPPRARVTEAKLAPMGPGDGAAQLKAPSNPAHAVTPFTITWHGVLTDACV